MDNAVVVIASDNQGKIREIGSYLDAFSLKLLPQGHFSIPPAEETGLSFIENALLKARHAAHFSQTPALADDSGLCVDALQGAPGIYSARFAGLNASDAANIEKLLEVTSELKPTQRKASFYCALAFVRHELDPVPILCVGKWDGELLSAPQGTKGFGYDPIFYVPEMHCSAAELDPAVKNKMSHRGKALKKLVSELLHEYPT